MSKIKEKRTRNRDPLKKQEKLQQIIDGGTKLFVKDGNKMSMRELARQMDIAVSGLYRYVQNKRELWFACIINEFETVQFSEKLAFMCMCKTYHAKSLFLIIDYIYNSFTLFFND